MKRWLPYFCPGCGMMVTREPWPHLDKALRPPIPEHTTKEAGK